MTKAEKLAEAHVEWEKRAIMRMYHEFDHAIVEIVDRQRELMAGMIECMFVLAKENFIHGYKHGKESNR